MGCLLVLEVLRGRGISLNSMCLICNQEPDTFSILYSHAIMLARIFIVATWMSMLLEQAP